MVAEDTKAGRLDVAQAIGVAEAVEGGLKWEELIGLMNRCRFVVQGDGTLARVEPAAPRTDGNRS